MQGGMVKKYNGSATAGHATTPSQPTHHRRCTSTLLITGYDAS